MELGTLSCHQHDAEASSDAVRTSSQSKHDASIREQLAQAAKEVETLLLSVQQREIELAQARDNLLFVTLVMKTLPL
jgi:hypothetical protein